MCGTICNGNEQSRSLEALQSRHVLRVFTGVHHWSVLKTKLVTAEAPLLCLSAFCKGLLVDSPGYIDIDR